MFVNDGLVEEEQRRKIDMNNLFIDDGWPEAREYDNNYRNMDSVVRDSEWNFEKNVGLIKRMKQFMRMFCCFTFNRIIRSSHYRDCCHT